jgi:hypothetical protein
MELGGVKATLGVCDKEKKYAEQWMGYYQKAAIFCVLLLVALIVVWVKYEKLGDSKVNLGDIEKRSS